MFGLSHLCCLIWTVSSGLSHLDCLIYTVSSGLSYLGCLIWTVSSGLSRLDCLIWTVSSILSHLDCLIWTVSSGLSHLDCLIQEVTSEFLRRFGDSQALERLLRLERMGVAKKQMEKEIVKIIEMVNGEARFLKNGLVVYLRRTTCASAISHIASISKLGDTCSRFLRRSRSHLTRALLNEFGAI